LDLLRLRGILAFQINTGAVTIGGRYVRFGARGLPDVLAVLPAHSAGGPAGGWAYHPAGRLLTLEVKTGAGRLTADQRAARDNLRAAGALVWEVRDLGELDALLREVLAVTA